MYNVENERSWLTTEQRKNGDTAYNARSIGRKLTTRIQYFINCIASFFPMACLEIIFLERTLNFPYHLDFNQAKQTKRLSSSKIVYTKLYVI